jgi:hypothetical protein
MMKNCIWARLYLELIQHPPSRVTHLELSPLAAVRTACARWHAGGHHQ